MIILLQFKLLIILKLMTVIILHKSIHKEIRIILNNSKNKQKKKGKFDLKTFPW